ncbi:MAG TPA: hypothetical protein VF427_02975, partial [Noviherbaspirillum sp.]
RSSLRGAASLRYAANPIEKKLNIKSENNIQRRTVCPSDQSTYPQARCILRLSIPWSIFNAHGWSIFGARQQNLRHASIETTAIYLHAEDDQRHDETTSKIPAVASIATIG